MRFSHLGAILLLLVALTSACAQPAPSVGDALTGVVTRDELPGGVAVVREHQGLTRASAGYSDVDASARFKPHTHIRAASITKTFVAATLLQLVAEGKLDLDKSIETYLPGRIRGPGIDGSAITVRHLLRHQSGLPEYFDGNTPVPTQPVTADQLLDAALKKPPLFAPGTAIKYTNTNYVIAGLLIEKLTGRPAAEEITRRIITPLGLRGTYFPGPGDRGLRAPFARGYELIDGDRKSVV